MSADSLGVIYGLNVMCCLTLSSSSARVSPKRTYDPGMMEAFLESRTLEGPLRVQDLVFSSQLSTSLFVAPPSQGSICLDPQWDPIKQVWCLNFPFKSLFPPTASFPPPAS